MGASGVLRPDVTLSTKALPFSNPEGPNTPKMWRPYDRFKLSCRAK